jgi:hypothetical protein
VVAERSPAIVVTAASSSASVTFVSEAIVGHALWHHNFCHRDGPGEIRAPGIYDLTSLGPCGRVGLPVLPFHAATGHESAGEKNLS